MTDTVDDLDSDPEPNQANCDFPLPEHRPDETPDPEAYEQDVQDQKALPKISRYQPRQELSGWE
jgi:hypothetical protein